jgi:hypothetical protein
MAALFQSHLTGFGQERTFAEPLFDHLISVKQQAISPDLTAHSDAYVAPRAAIGNKTGICRMSHRAA